MTFREHVRRLAPLALRARHLRRFLPRPPPVWGISPPGVELPKRALFTYKTSSFRLSPDHTDRFNFSHHGIGPAVVSALNSLGYVVDVVDYQHPDPQVEHAYDLFVGHMNINFMRIARRLPRHVPRIYLATTLPWRLNNELERKRLRDLRHRRGVMLPEERMLHFNEDPAYRASAGIICTGNELSRDTYAPHPRVIPVRNAAEDELRDIPASKDLSTARRHFLFYAGPGNVHKGLDLLLEIFPPLTTAGLHLHVCQHLHPSFVRVYERELQHTPGIHVHGVVAPRTREFYALVDGCAFLISPSCAEGGQGAVVEGMHQGLVPLVSRESTVDVAPNGFCLSDCSLATLTDAVRCAAELAPDEVHSRALATQLEARARYSKAAFVSAIRAAIIAILDGHQPA